MFSTDYFRRQGVSTMTVKELFDFITDLSINADNIDSYIDRLMAVTSQRSIAETTEQEKVDEAVSGNCRGTVKPFARSHRPICMTSSRCLSGILWYVLSGQL